MDLTGIEPSGGVRLLGDVGDIARVDGRAHFASRKGAAPIDASSGKHNRHRPFRAGSRHINRALHIMAIVQLHGDTEGRRHRDAGQCSGLQAGVKAGVGRDRRGLSGARDWTLRRSSRRPRFDRGRVEHRSRASAAECCVVPPARGDGRGGAYSARLRNVPR
ncbi:transposase [Micromonospora azadirachtae]|uniref:Transposase n=1 Tax=Micromonospora azadirachtae TaxID=1970735 RepID=A0ABW2ZV95_9ACTN